MSDSAHAARPKGAILRMPEAARWKLQDRLRQHERKWEVREIYFFTGLRPSAAYVRVGFLDPAMEVDGEDWMDLCRLEWTGSMERWKLGLPRVVGKGNSPAPPPLGTKGGSPEACVDAAVEKQLGWDPASPMSDSPARVTQAKLEALFKAITGVAPSSGEPAPHDERRISGP